MQKLLKARSSSVSVENVFSLVVHGMLLECTSLVAVGCCPENYRIGSTVNMCLVSRFKLLSWFLVPLEQRCKNPCWVTGRTSIALPCHGAFCPVLLLWGLEMLSKRDFVVSVLGETMVRWALYLKPQWQQSCRNEKEELQRGAEPGIYKPHLQLLPVYVLLSVFISWRDEKSIWKGLCWLQVSVALGGASCKNRQIWLQWQGVIGQLQCNCCPAGLREVLAGSREMCLPGEDSVANKPCPSLSVNSFGSRLAPEHLNIFMTEMQWVSFFFFPVFEMGTGVLHCFRWSVSPVWLFRRSHYSSHSLVVAVYLAEGPVKTRFSISLSYVA